MAVFCLVDDRLKGRRIRQCGPKLSDAEVLTIYIVGGRLCMDTNKTSTSSSAVTMVSGSYPRQGASDHHALSS